MCKKIFSMILVGGLLLVAACSDDDDTSTGDAGLADSGADQSTVDDTGPGDGGTPDGQAGDTASDTAAVEDGSSTKMVEEYVPGDNDVAGWVEDPDTGQPGVEAGYTDSDIDDLINGKHDPYAAEGCNGFAMQNYIKDFGGGCEATLELFIWDMASAGGAQRMFDKEKTDGETGANLVFEDIPNVQDKGIVANNLPVWEAYAYKSHYIMQITAFYGGPSCADTVKPDVITWIQHMTGILP